MTDWNQAAMGWNAAGGYHPTLLAAQLAVEEAAK